jgi:hypothetical protein
MSPWILARKPRETWEGQAPLLAVTGKDTGYNQGETCHSAMDQKIRTGLLSLEAAVGRSYKLEEHAGTTCLSLGVHTTPTPPIFQKMTPP